MYILVKPLRGIEWVPLTLPNVWVSPTIGKKFITQTNIGYLTLPMIGSNVEPTYYDSTPSEIFRKCSFHWKKPNHTHIGYRTVPMIGLNVNSQNSGPSPIATLEHFAFLFKNKNSSLFKPANDQEIRESGNLWSPKTVCKALLWARPITFARGVGGWFKNLITRERLFLRKCLKLGEIKR